MQKEKNNLWFGSLYGKIFFISNVFLTCFLIYAKDVQADANTIILDPANVTTCGTLNQAGATYVLKNDVSSLGSCFNIVASNVTLDLGGHTVTYDDAIKPTVLNGSFENGSGDSADSWNFSSAPNATRASGTFVNPVSVYDGSYRLNFSVPASDQQVRSSSQVTLEPNTTYTISAMLYNNYYSGGYQSDAITMFVGLDDGTQNKTATKTGINWRGFQYTYKTFTTGSTSESYNIIAGISGAFSAVAGNVFIDDIKIQKTKLAGVFVGSANWRAARYPDINQYGNATYATITNGKIFQGNGLSDYSDAIYVEETSGTGFNFNNLEITTKGANSHVILSYYMIGGEIHNNFIHHEVNTITSRDGYDGAAVKIEYGGDGGKIYDNYVDKGIQTAIVASTKSNAGSQMQIYGNNITLQTKYTNDFAISASGSIVHDNIVNCGSDNNSCRGIVISGIGTKVYNNSVSVQQLYRNQEYNGCEGSGAYGMQGEYTASGAEIYGNMVTANAGVCESTALRLNPDPDQTSASMNIHGNTFIAVSTGTQRASAMKLADITSSNIVIDGNIFKTNRRWIYLDYATYNTMDVKMVGNRWETIGIVDSPFYPFETNVITANFTFNNNVYGDGDQARFESQCWRRWVNMGDCVSGSTINLATSVNNYSISNFTTLFSNWLKTGKVSDLNTDNLVNTKDLGIMMSKWN